MQHRLIRQTLAALKQERKRQKKHIKRLSKAIAIVGQPLRRYRKAA